MEGKRGGGLKILALDSSGLVASVALAEDDNLIAEYTVQYKKTHSQTLLPMLEEIVRMVEMDLSTVDAIAVAAGPGSFTGLRIGSATAKGLAFASGTGHSGADGGWARLSDVRCERSGVSDYGRQKESGIYGNL